MDMKQLVQRVVQQPHPPGIRAAPSGLTQPAMGAGKSNPVLGRPPYARCDAREARLSFPIRLAQAQLQAR